MSKEIAQHLLPWVSGGWAGPYRLELLPTHKCNLSCQSCWRWQGNEDKDVLPQLEDQIPDERLLSLVEEAAQMGVREVSLSGSGEPLFRRDIAFQLMEMIKARGMKGWLQTNGTLFTPALIERLVAIGWDEVSISLDGPTAEINDALRPPRGTFERIMETLRLFRECKEKHKTRFPLLSLQCVLSPLNVRHVVPMFHIAKRFGVMHLGFELVKMFSERCRPMLLTGGDNQRIIQEQLGEVRAFLQGYPMSTNILSYEAMPTLVEHSGSLGEFILSHVEGGQAASWPALLNSICYEPWIRLQINSTGDSSFCCLVPSFPSENILRKTLKDIWLGETFSQCRRQLLAHQLLPSCHQCHTNLITHTIDIREHLRQLWETGVVQPDSTLNQPPVLEQKSRASEAALHVCLVSREYPPETGWGGIGRYTHILAHALARMGQRVSVVCQSLDVDRQYMDEAVSVHRVAHRPLFPFKGMLRELGLRWEYSQSVYEKLRMLIRDEKVDIVEAPNLSGEGFVYSLHKKVPLVTRLHTHFSEVLDFLEWEKTLDRRLSCWFENAAIARSDLVTCSTKAHAERVAHEVGIAADRIKIVPLGIPLPVLNGGNDTAHPTILFVGRLEKRKGIQVLIQAIPRVLQAFPDAECIIVGRDSYISKEAVSFDGDQTHSYKNILIRMLTPEASRRVRFLGYVGPEELDRLYRACTVFVAPSLYESFGFIYIEAMSYAKPVIGCGVGGVPEVVEDGVTGLLVPPADVSRLADALCVLLADPAQRTEMGRRGRLRVQEQFSQERMAANTIDAYVSVIELLKRRKRKS